MSKKLYLSGPVTGTADYRERFEAAERFAHAAFGADMMIFNPVKVNGQLPEGVDYEDYMRLSFAMLDCCDSILMLPGWKQSEGARREYKWAETHSKHVMEAPVLPERGLTWPKKQA